MPPVIDYVSKLLDFEPKTVPDASTGSGTLIVVKLCLPPGSGNKGHLRLQGLWDGSRYLDKGQVHILGIKSVAEGIDLTAANLTVHVRSNVSFLIKPPPQVVARLHEYLSNVDAITIAEQIQTSQDKQCTGWAGRKARRRPSSFSGVLSNGEGCLENYKVEKLGPV